MHHSGRGFRWRLSCRCRIRSAIRQASGVRKTKFHTGGTGGQDSRDYAFLAQRYYEADRLLLFEITFPRLDESVQKTWLAKFYDDEDFAFFSVAVRGLGADSPLFSDFAEKAYADEEIALFSATAVS